MMIEGFFAHVDYWSWLGLALFLFVMDSVVRGTFVMWMGVAAGVIGLLMLVLPSLGWQFQIGIFVVISVLGFVLWRLYRNKVLVHRHQPTPPPWQ